MNIKGAIFDLDGTLMDSMFIWDTIGEEYLVSRNIQPKENLNETFKTMSLKQAAEYYQSEYGLLESTDEIMNGVNSMIEDRYANDVKIKEGVAEFLEYLKAKGVKMCIATATDVPLVQSSLKSNGISEYFSEIFTCNTVGFGKDRPDIYDRALEFLNTNKEETIIFEDALYAVLTAKKAGYKVAGIFDEHEKYIEKVKENSDIFLNSYREASDIFD